MQGLEKKIVFGIGATLIAMAFFYYSDHAGHPAQDDKPEVSSEDTPDLSKFSTTSKDDKINLEGVSQTAIVSSAAISKLSDLSDEDKIEVQKNFSQHLKTIGECLKIQTVANSDKIEPVYDNLLSGLKPAIGEAVVQLDDWTQTDFQGEDGLPRRLRTEVNYDEPNAPVKTVQLYNINENGLPELQPIDPEKSRNPTDEFLNQLKTNSKITLDEHSSRVYFQQGEEIVLIERGGVIESFSLTKNGKTVSCTGLNAVGSNCQCIE